MQQNDQSEEYSCLEEYFIDSCRHGDFEDAVGCFEDNVDVFWMDDRANNCIPANGHLNIVEAIIQYSQKKGLNILQLINHQNSDGCTPLHWAVFNNQLKIIEFLLNNGADAMIKNTSDQTCLDQAFQYEREQVIDLLTKFCNIGEQQKLEFTEEVQEENNEEEVE